MLTHNLGVSWPGQRGGGEAHDLGFYHSEAPCLDRYGAHLFFRSSSLS